MAITNAQQYKQLLAKGGRIGFKGGADMGTVDAKDSKGNVTRAATNKGAPNVSAGGASFNDLGPEPSGDNYNTSKEEYLTGVGQSQLDKLYKDGVPKSNIPYFGTYLNVASPFRNFTLRKNIDYFKGLSQTKYPQTIQGYKDYMADRLAGKITATGNTNPNFYTDADGNFIPIDGGGGGNNNLPGDGEGGDALPTDPDDPFEMNLRLLADGGMPGDAPVYEGGIMDLETSRQMYGLGKLVKKITRGVKKIAKSPIGKAALLYFGGNALMGKMGGGKGLASFFSNLKGNLLGQAGSRVGESFVPFKEGLLTKLGLTKGGGSFMPTALGGIAASTIGSYLLTPDEKKQEIDYGADIEDPKTIMNDPYKYLNLRNYAEGGEVEPVAKKTMPLLDMDGKEMDLRAEGGFVPIGRMERADDVPARLSKNEFVFTADAVRNAGEGDVDKGAEVMYNMMKNLESGGEVSEESQGLEGAREMFQTSKRLEEVI